MVNYTHGVMKTMAKFYPQELSNKMRCDPQRAGEVKIYDALRQHLHGSWTVFYSVAWLGKTATEDVPRDGEVDFIVAHPEHGVLLIEVKGGRIRYDGTRRQWISTDRSNIDHDIDPFGQVIQCKYALLHKIKSLPAWSNRWISLGHAVAFPDCLTPQSVLPPEAPHEIIIDGGDLPAIETCITAIMQYWRGQEQQPTQHDAEFITTLEKLLVPTITLPNPLSLQVQDEEREILRLTEEQFRILDWLRRTRRAAISGCAGTGKTMLAVEKAKRLASEGFRTLLTCYNKPLATHLSNVIGHIESLTVCTFHQLCYRMAKEAGIDLPTVDSTNSQQIFDEIYPDALIDAMMLRPELRFDAIIVDEGQDFQDTWWVALEACLAEKRDSIFYVFFDDNQRVYGRRGSIPSDLQHISLTENVRNTRTICQALTSYYESDEQPSPRGPVGRSVEIHPYTKIEELRKLLHRILYKLTTIERLAYKDIVILTPKALQRSVLQSLRLDGNIRLVEQYRGQPQEVLYSTIHSFKGLERPLAIIIELDEDLLASAATRDTLCYVAFSRPRNHLILLGKADVIRSVLPGNMF